jgi:O-antigen/teichoic acid export membrane protein
MSSPEVGRRRITSDVAVQLAGRAVNIALGIVVTVVIIRTLGDDRFGQWATLMAVVQIAIMFGELGLEQVAVSRAAADPDRQSKWVWALLTVRTVLSIPVMLAAAAVVLLLSRSDEMLVAGLLLSSTLLVGAPNAMRIVFRLRVRNDVPIAVMTVNSVLWTAAAVTIAALDGGMVAFAAATVGTLAVTTALQLMLAIRALHERPALGRELWRDLLRAGAVLGVATLIITAYVRIDQIIVFELAGSRDAGLYGAAYRILDQAQAVPTVLMTTLLPLIAAAFKTNPERGRRLFATAMEYLAIAGLGALAFAIPAGTVIVETLFGADFREAGPALAVLMGAYVLIALSYPVDGMIVVAELQRRYAIHAVVGLVFNVALNLALVPTYGFMAAAWATLATEVVVLGLNYSVVRARAGVVLPLPRLARTAVAATAMSLIVWGLHRAGAGLVPLVLAALVAYPAWLLALGALRPGELRSLLRREGDFGRTVG